MTDEDQPPDIALVDPRRGDDSGDPAHPWFWSLLQPLARLPIAPPKRSKSSYGSAAISGGTNLRRASIENSRSAL